MDLEKHIIQSTSNAEEAMQKVNDLPQTLTLFVIDEKSRVVGALTDGDIRRGLLKGLSMSEPVERFMMTDFKAVRSEVFEPFQLRKIAQLGIKAVPVLDDQGNLVNVIDPDEQVSVLPLSAVIMAGGRGKRLRPLTDDRPKPLIEVGERPIIDINVSRLEKFGFKHVDVCVRYLGEMIEKHFSDRQNKIPVNFTYENEPRGTLGAVKLIDALPGEDVMVMNSDLMTDIDFEEMYNEYRSGGYDFMMASMPYNYNIPYAVLDTDGEVVKGIREKPRMTHYSNAGIYIFNKELLEVIPDDEAYDAPDLIQHLLDNNGKVGHFAITGYWLDIGQPQDLEKARQDIKHLRL